MLIDHGEHFGLLRRLPLVQGLQLLLQLFVFIELTAKVIRRHARLSSEALDVGHYFQRLECANMVVSLNVLRALVLNIDFL